jgi:hypothetical protein
MERGHIILIAGAAMLIAGIAVAAISGVSFASRFVSDNTIVGRTTIGPGQSVSAKTDVSEMSKTLTLTVGLDGSGTQQPSPQEVRLKETITDPQDRVVNSNEFGDSYVTTIRPQSTGAYTVAITNLGSKAVTVAGTFGYFPIIGPDGKPDLNALFGTGQQQQGLGIIIAGGVAAVAGVIVLIVGGVITVADGQSQRGTSTTTSEGGITYRRD